MTDELLKEIVAAIRADEVVGRGTCSTWDECYSDEELAADFATNSSVKTVKQAIAFARRIEKLRWEREGECF